jgi:hypothetical protein
MDILVGNIGFGLEVVTVQVVTKREEVRRELMGKKKTIDEIIYILRNQQAEHGDLASIEDLIDLILKKTK